MSFATQPLHNENPFVTQSATGSSRSTLRDITPKGNTYKLSFQEEGVVSCRKRDRKAKMVGLAKGGQPLQKKSIGVNKTPIAATLSEAGIGKNLANAACSAFKTPEASYDKRRHIDESQREMVADTLANLKHGVRSDTAIAVSTMTQDAGASALNVSVDRGRTDRHRAARKTTRGIFKNYGYGLAHADMAARQANADRGHTMTAPLRHIASFANAEPLRGRGHRSPSTLAAITMRDALLREAARLHFPGLSAREATRRLRGALLRFREGSWRRARIAETCPARHHGRLGWHCWHILREIDHVPSETTIRTAIRCPRGGLQCFVSLESELNR